MYVLYHIIIINRISALNHYIIVSLYYCIYMDYEILTQQRFLGIKQFLCMGFLMGLMIP
ncbi:hypothetical protein BZA77DRAFT_317825 [Pyronema omphalodes]|nr:hypothetical protein BZA77DRAFT_317825 [Pyronema omphalodes]